jgi:hypothetical protein
MLYCLALYCFELSLHRVNTVLVHADISKQQQKVFSTCVLAEARYRTFLLNSATELNCFFL